MKNTTMIYEQSGQIEVGETVTFSGVFEPAPFWRRVLFFITRQKRPLQKFSVATASGSTVTITDFIGDK